MERFTSSGEKEKSVQDTLEYTSLQVIFGFEYVHIYWIGLTSTGWTGMGVSCRTVFHAGIKEIFECWMTRVDVRMLTETLLQRNRASSLPWLFGPNGPRETPVQLERLPMEARSERGRSFSPPSPPIVIRYVSSLALLGYSYSVSAFPTYWRRMHKTRRAPD